MLRVDLGRLERKERVRVVEALPADDPRWAEVGVRAGGPLEVDLDVTRVGRDVLVRGWLRGEAVSECRRCLREVRVAIDETETVLYRSGLTAVEAEAEEAYPLPEHEPELDLWPAVREQLLLAAPEYVLCAPDCRGLCPRCGTNLNEGACDCGAPEPDERWAALRGLKPNRGGDGGGT
jgi:uncharacterized protein